MELKTFNFLNDRYITYRKEWIKQAQDGSRYYTNKKIPLVDTMLLDHVKGKSTLGIKVKEISKFLALDIDVYTKNIEEDGKRAILDLLHVLKLAQVEENNIGIYFSGNKGYHIDIYVEEPVKAIVLKEFYNNLMILYNRLFNSKGVNIECRGCNLQGYKLPFGIHQKTKKWMWALNISTLEEEPNIIPNIKPINAKKFYQLNEELKQYIDLTLSDDLQDVLEVKEDKYINKLTEEDIKSLEGQIEHNKDLVNKVLQANSLISKGTRNNIIFLLALYCNSVGMTRKKGIDTLNSVISSTPKELFVDNTSLEWKIEQNKKVIDKVYSKGWKLAVFTKEVRISKKELEYMLKNCKTMKEMQVYMCFMIYAKRFANVDGALYLSQLTISKETGVSRQKVSSIIKTLQEKGMIELVKKGYYIENKKIKIASTYKVPNLDKDYKKCDSVAIKKALDTDITKAVKKLISIATLRKQVTYYMLKQFA